MFSAKFEGVFCSDFPRNFDSIIILRGAMKTKWQLGEQGTWMICETANRSELFVRTRSDKDLSFFVLGGARTVAAV